MEQQKIDVTLTPREQHRLRNIAHCRQRIERKIKGDPGSVRVNGWKARLADYERAEAAVILAAQLRVVAPGRFPTHRAGDIAIAPPSAGKPPTKH
jgi:hypothetical protein